MNDCSYSSSLANRQPVYDKKVLKSAVKNARVKQSLKRRVRKYRAPKYT